MDDEVNFEVILSIDDVRSLLYSLEKGIERWAGGPAEEQERLYELRDKMRAMILEYNFYKM